MTTMEPDVQDPPADVHAPPAEELAKISEAAKTAWEKQASFRLLNAHDAVWHAMEEPGVHVVTVDGQLGVFDTGKAQFVPDDWTEMSARLGAKMAAAVGAAAFPLGDDGATAVVDWSTVEIIEDAASAIRIWVDSVPRPDGGHYELTMQVTPEGAAAVEDFELVGATADGDGQPVDGAADAAATADSPGITGEYLGQHYGDAEFHFGGHGYVVDWTTWHPDAPTEDGRYGARAGGTRSDNGAYHDLYVWFDPQTGVEIAEATDPSREHFERELVPVLHDRWKDAPQTLADENQDKHYDVTGWLNGESGSTLDYAGYDGSYYYATMVASTVADQPAQVRCHLRMEEGANNVVVYQEESV